MANKNGYLLTASNMLNEWIIKHSRLCLATKRGLNGSPFFRWFERGTDEYDLPITHVMVLELKHNVDILWIGDSMKNTLACVTLTDGEQLLIEEKPGLVPLSSYYPSYFN